MTDKQNISEFFDSYAGHFETIYGGQRNWWYRLIDRLFRKSMRLRFIRTMDECYPIQGRSALDVGCGPGYYSLALARLGAGEIWGIDFSAKMIEMVRGKADQSGLAEKCRFLEGEFLAYNFDRQFDYVIVIGFMDYVLDAAAVVEKTLSLARIKVVFSFPASEGFLAWQRRYRYRKKCDLYMYRRKDVENLFRSAGISGIKIEKLSRDYFVTVTIN